LQKESSNEKQYSQLENNGEEDEEKNEYGVSGL
jgi:hypothetical protein